MIKVFISGPISPKGREPVNEFLINVRQGLSAASDLVHHGFAPYCPFTDFLYWFASEEQIPLPTGETMQRCDAAWLEVADAVLLLPRWELSAGCREEFDRALALGKPVFHSVAELVEYYRKEGE
jgi:hypothetical protein